MKVKPFTLYLLSFIEGACVMAAELLGAKMLAPFFGASLYVWSTVLAITLGGLASGYFAGGRLSNKDNSSKLLFYIILLAAAFLALMPFSAKFLLHYLTAVSLLPALLIASMVFLLPPVFLMGMVSPLLISAIAKDEKESGRVAGSIYAISTCGGILATFLLGFYIIPEFGLIRPAIAFAFILAFIPVAILVQQKKYFPLVFFLFSVWLGSAGFKTNTTSDILIRYQKEGLLGQLLVVDYPVYSENKTTYYRYLFCNRIVQSMYCSTDSVHPYLPYVGKIESELQHLKQGSKVLILGLGGGVLANVLQQKGMLVDAVDLDNRLPYVAHTFFNLSPKVNLITDDARHYLNACSVKYDVLIFDVFKGEETPNHVLTKESIEIAKKLLQVNGCILINGNGYLNGDVGKGMRSICKTLVRSGLNVKVLTTGNDEAYRNVLFVAGNGLADKLELMPDTSDAVVLSDEFPVLDKLNKEANLQWRKGYIQNSIRDFEQRNIPLFE